jgi:ABC-type nitrate/sulfonate/bicarbonate transport system permease component
LSPNHGRTWKKILFVACLLAIWQGLAVLKLYNQLLLPSPIEIGQAFVGLMQNGQLMADVLSSVKRVVVGFAVATGLGVTLAVLLVSSRPLAEYLGTVLEFLRPVPPIAWIPISILWFGIGDPPAFFIVVLGSFFPIFVNCFSGIRHVDRRFVLIAKSYNASTWQVLRRVYLPLTLPYLMSGMRVGLGVGWMSVITAELVGAQNGLGYMMQLNRVLLQTQNVMVGMVLVGLLGFVMNRVMLSLEKVVTPWIPTEQ